jgi:hypothetical protein
MSLLSCLQGTLLSDLVFQHSKPILLPAVPEFKLRGGLCERPDYAPIASSENSEKPPMPFHFLRLTWRAARLDFGLGRMSSRSCGERASHSG